MRFGPILVPIAIVASIFVIVGAESGWFDSPVPEPVFIHAQAGIHGAPPTAPRRVASNERDTGVPTGRSALPTPRTNPTARAGDVLPAPDRPVVQPVKIPSLKASPPADTLEEARAEADKARQDVVDVTQASIAAQAAAEAEAMRQKSEFEGRIAQLEAKLDDQAKGSTTHDEAEKRLQADLAATRMEAAEMKRQLAARRDETADLGKLKTQAGATAQAEAAAATAAAELADARTRERSLRQQLAGLQATGADKMAEASKGTAAQAAAGLQADLAGARRGEATLRQENAMLQRELAEARQSQPREKVADASAASSTGTQDGRSIADGRTAVALAGALRTAEAELTQMRAARARDTVQLETLHSLLATLGPPRQQGVRILSIPGEKRAARRGRGDAFDQRAATNEQDENRRLVGQRGSLQREQMHMQLDDLRKEADAMQRARQ